MTVNAEPVRFAVPYAADVIVIGDGVIGLSTALELARNGARCVLVGHARAGAASGAAAGLLAPSIGDLPPVVRAFFFASLQQFPEYVEQLLEFDAELAIVRGLIDVSTNRTPAAGVDSLPLTPDDVVRLDPAVRAPRGARLYEQDGAVDNVRLVNALRHAVAQAGISQLEPTESVAGIELSSSAATVRLESGARIDGGTIIIAAGAWSAQIAGLPRALPVAPLKGQMLAMGFDGLRHPVSGNDVYLVPRRGEVAIGATAEHAGFDTTVHADAIEGMRRSACAICPELAAAPIVRTWAGLRPATPDLLPIIGRDPELDRLIYACGHSKNGILLAPATARAVAALAQNRSPLADLSPFSIERFASSRNQ